MLRMNASPGSQTTEGEDIFSWPSSDHLSGYLRFLFFLKKKFSFDLIVPSFWKNLLKGLKVFFFFGGGYLTFSLGFNTRNFFRILFQIKKHLRSL